MTLYLLRGLPGSGKSTLAQSLDVENRFEADNYFLHDGVYAFDPLKIAVAHKWCQDLTSDALSRGESVAVSNTFTQHWELAPYYAIANMHGAQVCEVIVNTGLTDAELAARNIHKVPEAVIAKMRTRWQQ